MQIEKQENRQICKYRYMNIKIYGIYINTNVYKKRIQRKLNFFKEDVQFVRLRFTNCLNYSAFQSEELVLTTEMKIKYQEFLKLIFLKIYFSLTSNFHQENITCQFFIYGIKEFCAVFELTYIATLAVSARNILTVIVYPNFLRVAQCNSTSNTESEDARF